MSIKLPSLEHLPLNRSDRSAIFRTGLCWIPQNELIEHQQLTEERTATKTTSGRFYEHTPTFPTRTITTLNVHNIFWKDRSSPYFSTKVFIQFLQPTMRNKICPKLHCWWSRGLIVDPLHLVPQETCRPILLLLRENIQNFSVFCLIPSF